MRIQSNKVLSNTAARTGRPDGGGKAHAHRHTTGITVETMNDDFVSKGTNLPRARGAVVMVQEAKNDHVRRDEPQGYGAHWNGGREDQAGTAVLWDKKDPHLKATQHRGYAMGVEPGRAKMLARWINWTDVKVDGQTVRMISVHRPPKRFSFLWPQFDRNVAAFVKHSKVPVVIGMDSNEAGGPKELARLTGLRWVGDGRSIDGFLVSKGIEVEKVKSLPKGTSDHHPVIARLRIHTPAK